MFKRLAFTLTLSTLVVGLASARQVNSAQVTLTDTLVYYLDGKVISSARFLKLEPGTLARTDVDMGVGTVKGYTKGVTTPAESPLYQSKATKIDWSVAKTLQDVSFIVDDKVTDAQKARSIATEQIESVYQLPPSEKGPNGEVGSFGKNGVVIVTTKKN